MAHGQLETGRVSASTTSGACRLCNQELIQMSKDKQTQISLSSASDGEQTDQQTLSVSEIYKSVLRDYPDVLDVSQVSAILGVSTKTVYRLLNSGELASLKIGRAFKIPKLYVLQYIKVISA
jgi:excisionase family DNA binding protein